MGGRRPTVPAEVVRQWETYRDRRLQEGASLWRIATECAQRSGNCVRPRTAYLYLDPTAMERARRNHLKSYHRGVNRADNYRKYTRNYRRLERQPMRYLNQAFGPDSEAEIETLSSRLVRLCEGVRFTPKTLTRILNRYLLSQDETSSSSSPYLVDLGRGRWYYGPRRASSDEEAREPLAVVLLFAPEVLLWAVRIVRGVLAPSL